MGFFKKMFEEAGTKAGSAIGNKLWGNSTDYVRIGERPMSKSEKELQEISMLFQQAEMVDRLQAKADQTASDQMQWIMDLHFSPTDVDYNLTVLSDLCTFLDSLPTSKFARSANDDKLYRAAKSKFESGIILCKAKEPNNPGLQYFEGKQY